MTTQVASGGSDPSAPLRSLDELARLFESFGKERDGWLIGMEYERLPVSVADGRAVSFDSGIEPLLNRLADEDGWTRGLENGRTIFLRRGSDFITLEPGGQIEYSSAAAPTIAGLFSELRAVIGSLDRIAGEMKIGLLGLGYQPFSAGRDIGWVPKRRYDFMAPYLAPKGDLAHEMMKMTAGIQVALDYSDARDAMRKLAAAAILTPIAQALFANSGIGLGRPLDHLCWRGQIWTRTDRLRCDVPEFMLDPDSGIDEYVSWLSNVPLMFLERDGVFTESRGATLGSLIREGRATVYDALLAMTQVFPEVRLKNFVEIRSVDSQPPWLAPTVPCFWSSLLYGELDAIFALFGAIGPAEFSGLRDSAMRFGLKGEFRGESLAAWARRVLEVAARSSTCETSMKILRERVETGITPAEAAQRLLAECAGPAEFVERWNRHRWS